MQEPMIRRPAERPWVPPAAWTAWYRFARDELGYEHAERVEYANHRYVEDLNHASLRRRGRAATKS
jgi:hypothetical protein